MTKPVLLIVTSDDCVHCEGLIADKNRINNAVKSVASCVRIVWCCLDNRKSSKVLFPLYVPYVPLVVFFPEGLWDPRTGSGKLNESVTMTVSDMENYEGPMTRKIPNWLLDKLVESQFKRRPVEPIGDIWESTVVKEEMGNTPECKTWEDKSVARKPRVISERIYVGAGEKVSSKTRVMSEHRCMGVDEEKGRVKSNLTFSFEDGVKLEIGSGNVRFAASFNVMRFLMERLNLAIS